MRLLICLYFVRRWFFKVSHIHSVVNQQCFNCLCFPPGILGKMGTLLPCLAQQSRKAPILPYPVLQLMEVGGNYVQDCLPCFYVKEHGQERSCGGKNVIVLVFNRTVFVFE